MEKVYAVHPIYSGPPISEEMLHHREVVAMSPFDNALPPEVEEALGKVETVSEDVPESLDRVIEIIDQQKKTIEKIDEIVEKIESQQPGHHPVNRPDVTDD